MEARFLIEARFLMGNCCGPTLDIVMVSIGMGLLRRIQ